MSAPAVVIAASNLMPSLRERLADDGELVVFPDTEPIQALQAILEHRPSLIVLERLFAATPRGAALINRIKNDPHLGHAEVRVMSHSGDYRRVVSKPSGAPPPQADAVAAESGSPNEGAALAAEAPAAAAVAAEPPPRPLDWHGTRRAARHRIRQGVEIQLDGNPAQVVDLSHVGAQVISQTILRPNQKVRVSVPNDDFVMRFRGSIAWAKFELPDPSAPPRYRAGIEFADADARAVEAYCQKNKAN
jgi:PilZ domain